MTDQTARNADNEMEPEDVTAAELCRLYCELGDDVHEIVAGITETEINIRLDQILAGLPDLGAAADDYADPLLAFDMPTEALTPADHASDMVVSDREDAVRLRWEAERAYLRAVQDGAAAEQKLAKAEDFLDAAVERAKAILDEAHLQAQATIADAEATAQRTLAQASQMVQDAETLCQLMIDEASRESAHVAGQSYTRVTATADPWVRQVAGGAARLLRVPETDRAAISVNGIGEWVSRLRAHLKQESPLPGPVGNAVLDVNHNADTFYNSDAALMYVFVASTLASCDHALEPAEAVAAAQHVLREGEGILQPVTAPNRVWGDCAVRSPLGRADADPSAGQASDRPRMLPAAG